MARVSRVDARFGVEIGKLQQNHRACLDVPQLELRFTKPRISIQDSAIAYVDDCGGATERARPLARR